MGLTKEKFLSDREVKKLFGVLDSNKDDRNSKIIRMLLYTGARSVEALNICKRDLQDGEVMIYGVKGSNDRAIPLPKLFYKEMVEYAKPFAPEAKLFNITTSMLRKIWKKWTPNPRKSLHSTRHTCGIRIIKTTQKISLVQTILGHKSRSNSELYATFEEGKKEVGKCVKGLY